jgi:hypothetical protein
VYAKGEPGIRKGGLASCHISLNHLNSNNG